MKMVIEIDVENSAFRPEPEPELYRILLDVVKTERIVEGRNVTLHDGNGNGVGQITWKGARRK